MKRATLQSGKNPKRGAKRSECTCENAAADFHAHNSDVSNAIRQKLRAVREDAPSEPSFNLGIRMAR